MKPQLHSLVQVLLLLLVFLSGCGGQDSQSKSITVAVAANAVPAVEAIAERFEKANDCTIILVPGASGNLARQAREAAPFDVFLSADRQRVQELEDAGMVARSGIYANGVLVLWIPSLGETKTETLVDALEYLRQTRVVAIAHPEHAPYGKAAMEFLEKEGLAAGLGSRIVQGESVAQALQYGKSGNADAVFVPLTLVLEEKGVFVVPDDRYMPIEQAGALLRRGEENPLAGKFFDDLFTPESRKVFAEAGYKP